MKLLVTGFEPFGGREVNASWLAVEQLPAKIGKIEIVKCQIPCVAYKSVERVLEAADTHCVDKIICVGENGSSAQVNVELIGTNWLDLSIPDNEGNQVRNSRSYHDGPDALFARIDAFGIAKSIDQLPVSLSLSAGGYICNHTLYGILHHQKRPAGFVHVPVESGTNSLDTLEAAKCLGAIIAKLE